MQKHNIRIWAHRGARSVAPENTLAAAQAALIQGADGWEFDVHLTADHEAVVIHDHGLRRTTNIAQMAEAPVRRHQVVTQLTLAQIKTLDAGSWFIRRDPFKALAQGKAFGSEQVITQQRIPTLVEALTWSQVQNMFVNVELKSTPGTEDNVEALAQEVASCLHKTGMSQKALISSFSPHSLKYFKKFCPQVPVGLLLDRKSMEQSNEVILAMLDQVGAWALHPACTGLSPGRIAFFRKAGFHVNVYTVNQEQKMIWLMEEGATALITDYPGRGKRVRDSFTP